MTTRRGGCSRQKWQIENSRSKIANRKAGRGARPPTPRRLSRLVPARPFARPFGCPKTCASPLFICDLRFAICHLPFLLPSPLPVSRAAALDSRTLGLPARERPLARSRTAIGEPERTNEQREASIVFLDASIVFLDASIVLLNRRCALLEASILFLSASILLLDRRCALLNASIAFLNASIVEHNRRRALLISALPQRPTALTPRRTAPDLRRRPRPHPTRTIRARQPPAREVSAPRQPRDLSRTGEIERGGAERTRRREIRLCYLPFAICPLALGLLTPRGKKS